MKVSIENVSVMISLAAGLFASTKVSKNNGDLDKMRVDSQKISINKKAQAGKLTPF